MKQCKCGSMAFNLAREGIDQGDLCDRHYWQDRAEKAEALIEKCEVAMKSSNYDRMTEALAAIAAHKKGGM